MTSGAVSPNGSTQNGRMGRLGDYRTEQTRTMTASLDPSGLIELGGGHHVLDVACLIGRTAAPRSFSRNGHPQLSSPANRFAFLARQQSRSRPPSTLFRPDGAVRSSPILSTAIEVAVVAARTTRKDLENGYHRRIH